MHVHEDCRIRSFANDCEATKGGSFSARNEIVTELVLEPGRTEKNYWRDLWRYRELFYFLAWRDILVRYKQTVIGVAWALIRPLLTTLIFTVVFSRIASLPSPEGIPYTLLVMAAMLPWQFFSTALTESSNSLIGNSNLISKIYFPRLIVPAGSVITSFVDFLITLGLMGVLMVWYHFAPQYHFTPDWRMLTLPLLWRWRLESPLGLVCGCAR
jgi:lipopolysaccharide transport system permease protein